MASVGALQPGTAEGEPVEEIVTPRAWRSRIGALQTFSISGEGGSLQSSRVSSSKRVKTAAAEGSNKTVSTVRSDTDSKSKKQAAKHDAELNANIWSQTDENVLVILFASLHFMELYQVPSISKKWMRTFLFDPFFRSEVCRSAASWKTYSPVYVSKKKGLLVGYDGSSHHWCHLPPHLYLPIIDRFEWNLRAADGSLLCWVLSHGSGQRRGTPLGSIIVANPLTKIWGLLPTQPNTSFPVFVHLVMEENEAYKTVLCSTIDIAYRIQRPGSTINVGVQIFHSTDGAWTEASYFAEDDGKFELPGCIEGGSAVIHGVLYMLFYHWKDLNRSKFNFMLLSLDLKTKVFKQTTLLDRVFSARDVSRLSQLVVCRSKLMLVMKTNDIKYHISGGQQRIIRPSNGTLTIFWFDLEHMALIQVSQAPKKTLDKHYTRARFKKFGEMLTVAACNGDSIYISNHEPLRTSICFNVGTQEWHSFISAPAILSVDGAEDPTWDHWEWSSISYQPKVNPFFEVNQS